MDDELDTITVDELTDLSLIEASVVPQGDNKGAHIVMTKSKPGMVDKIKSLFKRRSTAAIMDERERSQRLDIALMAFGQALDMAPFDEDPTGAIQQAAKELIDILDEVAKGASDDITEQVKRVTTQLQKNITDSGWANSVLHSAAQLQETINKNMEVALATENERAGETRLPDDLQEMLDQVAAKADAAAVTKATERLEQVEKELEAMRSKALKAQAINEVSKFALPGGVSDKAAELLVKADQGEFGELAREVFAGVSASVAETAKLLGTVGQTKKVELTGTAKEVETLIQEHMKAQNVSRPIAMKTLMAAPSHRSLFAKLREEERIEKVGK